MKDELSLKLWLVVKYFNDSEPSSMRNYQVVLLISYLSNFCYMFFVSISGNKQSTLECVLRFIMKSLPSILQSFADRAVPIDSDISTRQTLRLEQRTVYLCHVARAGRQMEPIHVLSEHCKSTTLTFLLQPLLKLRYRQMSLYTSSNCFFSFLLLFPQPLSFL